MDSPHFRVELNFKWEKSLAYQALIKQGDGRRDDDVIGDGKSDNIALWGPLI